MQKLVFKNANGVEIDLTSSPYGITEWEGLAGADLNIQTQQVPFEDGAVFLDALIDQREIAITLAIKDDNNLETRYALRRELISVLNPKLGEGVLVYTNDFISKQIHCIPQIPIFENHNSNDAGTPKASLSWTACSPYWEDLEETVVEDITPFSIKTINNEGDLPSQVKININIATDVVSNIKIRNETTKQEIEVLGNTSTGLVINTGNGEKTVTGVAVKQEQMTGVITGIISANNILYGFMGNKIKRSPDGLKWETVYTNTVESISKLKYIAEKSVFIALCNTSSYHSVVISYDGITWNRKNLYDNITGWDLRDAEYISSLQKYLIIGTHRKYVTEDFVEYTKYTDSNTWNGIVEQESNVVIFGKNYNGRALLETSTDCETWTSRTTPLSTVSASFISAVLYKTRIFVLADNGSLIYSDNTTDWTSDNSIASDYKKIATTLDGNRVVIYGNTDVIITKTGTVGASWSQVNTGAGFNFDSFADFNGAGVFYQNNYVYMVTYDYSSFIKYETEYVSFQGNLDKIVTNEEGTMGLLYSYIASPAQDFYYKTTDFRQYEQIEETLSGTPKYINGKFYLLGDSIFSSSDLETWEEYDITQYGSARDMTYSKELNKWAFTTSNNKLWVGDFENGFEDVTPSYFDWGYIEWVSFLHSFVVASTSTKRVYNSSDGENWDSQEVGDTSKRYIYVIENKVYCGQSAGIVWYTKDLINWAYVLNTQGTSMAGDNNGNLIITSTASTFPVSYNKGSSFVSVPKDSGVTSDWSIIYVKKQNGFVLISANTYIYMFAIVKEGNKINRLSPTSDMSFKLIQGENDITMTVFSGQASATLTYRQKYIGV